MVAADINLEGVNNLIEEIKQDGGEATSIFLDALEEESIKEMIAKTKETYGKIDILHNNVGGTNPNKDHRVVDLDADTWDFTY